MSRKKKIALFAGIPVVLAASAFALMSRGGKSDLIEVQTSPVEAQKIVQTVVATGRIQPVTQINISADVSAKITRLAVKEGDWVETRPVPARARPRALSRRGRERRGQPALVGGRCGRRPREPRQGREGPRAHSRPARQEPRVGVQPRRRGVGRRGRQGPPALRAGPRLADPRGAQAGAGRAVEDDDLRPDGRHRVEAQQGDRRDRARLAVPGGHHPRARQPRRHGGAGRRRRERHRPARARRRGDDRGRRAARGELQGDGHRHRQQRQDRRSGHDRTRRPSSRSRSRSSIREASCALA